MFRECFQESLVGESRGKRVKIVFLECIKESQKGESRGKSVQNLFPVVIPGISEGVMSREDGSTLFSRSENRSVWWRELAEMWVDSVSLKEKRASWRVGYGGQRRKN